MLSRVAENVYWLARYLERVENTSRLILSTHMMLLDLPKEVPISWQSLFDIMGAWDEEPPELLGNADEVLVMRFLMTDRTNSSSIFSSISSARENGRTTREVMPPDFWPLINALYIYCKENQAAVHHRQNRLEFLQHIIDMCLQIQGVIATCMNQGNTYRFLCLGQNIERADMITRIIDVRAANFLDDRQVQLQHYGQVVWMNVLNSLSAYTAYRREMAPDINTPSVLAFLLTNSTFPRAFLCCCSKLEIYADLLPQTKNCQFPATPITDSLCEMDFAATNLAQLHELMDELQVELIHIHHFIEQTYFKAGIEEDDFS